MDSRFKIFHKGCNLSIYGLEQNGDEYMYEDYMNDGVEDEVSPSFRQYKYSESVTINVIYSVAADNTYTTEFIDIIPHDDRVDQTDYVFKDDGLYEICHMILPTKEFVDSLKTNQHWGDLKNKYPVIYYYDGEEFRKYTPHDDVDEPTTIEFILEVNDPNSSIIKASQNTFNVCYMENCLYKTVYTTLQNSWGKCQTPKTNNFERDLLWMAVHVIKYLIEFNQFLEAQRIIETFADCGYSCSHSKIYSNECRCSR